MQDKFQELIHGLSRSPAVPASVTATTCPKSSRQIIPKLLDIDVPPAVLTRTLADVFAYPVYEQARHGEFAYICPRREWGYAAGILFVACPFDSSLQPAVLLPPDACEGFSGFGLLPVSGVRVDPGDERYDRAQAEKMICRWLEESVGCHATDLHIAPLTAKYVRARIRVDGELRTLDEIPMSGEETSYRFISNILLKMMNCESGSFIKPVDGRFEYQASGRCVEVRAAMRPISVQGIASQAFYLRLLGVHDAGSLMTFSQLGFSPAVQAIFSDIRRLNQGLVLITGPTGSGKSTTLYANLAKIVEDDPGRSVQTLEDPVELDIRGIDQTQINEAIGMGFHDGLRALMRSDVDVILVGEVRDQDTASLAVRASLTGHLVFATVHARDALSAIERMIDLGVNPKALALVLSAVFAQRLVRRVCPQCCSERAFSRDRHDPRYADLFSLADRLKEANLAGCSRCDGGYRGRCVVIECARVSQCLSQAVATEAGVAVLQQVLAEEGSETLWENAASLVKRGEVTLAECVRQLPAHWQGNRRRDAQADRFSETTSCAIAHHPA